MKTQERCLTNAEKVAVAFMMAEKQGFGPTEQQRFKKKLYESLGIKKDKVADSATATFLAHATVDITQARQEAASAFANVLEKGRKHPYKPHPEILLNLTPIYMAEVVHTMTEHRPLLQQGVEYWGAHIATAIVGAERSVVENGIERRLPIASDNLVHRGRVTNDQVIFQFGQELSRLSNQHTVFSAQTHVSS